MTGMEMRYSALLPEVVLLAAAVLALLWGSFLPLHRQVLTRWFTLGSLVVSAAAGLTALLGPDDSVFTDTYTIDQSSGVIRILAPIATMLVILIGRWEFVASPRESETYSLLLLSTLGTVVLAGATDLLVLVAGFLLASIPMYALIGLSRSKTAAEATVKTYLMGALFGVLLLAGVTVLTGLAASSTYSGMASGLDDAPYLAVAGGAGAVLIGLLFKAGGVPGHFWVPDAAQASGTAIAAFVTTVPKLGALVALARLVDVMPPTVDVPLLVAVLAAVSMTVGNLAALAQTNVKRLLGWSTVSQVGYLLMPVAVIGRADDAAPALSAYLVFYSVTNIGAFAVVTCLPGRPSLTDYAGVARRHPWLTGSLVVAALSLVGTPPTAVFFGKLAVFTAAWDGGMAWLVVVAAVNTVLSLVYYLRLLTAPFWAGSSGGSAERTSVHVAAAVPITLAVVILVIGFVDSTS